MREMYLDIEIGGITEDGTNALRLCLHIYFLNFAWLQSVGVRILCEGSCEGSLAGLLGWSGEG